MGSRKTNQPPPPPTATQALGQIVREQRKSLKLTQEDLALSAGVGLAFLYELEHGKATVRLDKVLAVLRTLGIAVACRLGRPEQPAGSITDELPRAKS